MKEYDQLSARALAKAIRKQKISSVEATKEAISRLKAAHEVTNCIVALDKDALKAAKRIDADIDKGKHRRAPLDGVPLAPKGKKAPTATGPKADQFRPRLINLPDDPGETKDVSATYPEIARQLAATLKHHRAQGFSRD